jgi:transcriptional regulator with XRE-family HTH domain
MRIINRKVSQLILAERTKLGLTQKQLAIRLGLRSGQYVHNIEKLQCNFPPKKIAKLSLALSIPLEKIKYAMMEDYIEAVKFEIEKSLV